MNPLFRALRQLVSKTLFILGVWWILAFCAVAGFFWFVITGEQMYALDPAMPRRSLIVATVGFVPILIGGIIKPASLQTHGQ